MANDIHKAVYSVADETTKKEAARVLNVSITPSSPRNLSHASIPKSLKRELEIITSIEDDDDTPPPPRRIKRPRFMGEPSSHTFSRH